MYLLNHNTHTVPLFEDSNILKFPDKIDLENCIFIKKYFNQTLPTLFKNWFNLSTDSRTLFVVKAENICWNTIKMHKTMVTELSEVNLYLFLFWHFEKSSSLLLSLLTKTLGSALAIRSFSKRYFLTAIASFNCRWCWIFHNSRIMFPDDIIHTRHTVVT